MIINMYISLMPVVFTGILNMVWCKIPVLKSLSKPMDGGKYLKDGQRVFGENKTWKGFLGYIILGIICTVLWGIICGGSDFLLTHNYFYVNYDNTLSYNLLIGFLLGISYALFELPNSFVKRRFRIASGKSVEGSKKWIFIFLDQADSLFGCIFILSIVYKMSLIFYLSYVFLGAITHLIINMLLYALHLRKNMF